MTLRKPMHFLRLPFLPLHSCESRGGQTFPNGLSRNETSIQSAGTARHANPPTHSFTDVLVTVHCVSENGWKLSSLNVFSLQLPCFRVQRTLPLVRGREVIASSPASFSTLSSTKARSTRARRQDSPQSIKEGPGKAIGVAVHLRRAF